MHMRPSRVLRKLRRGELVSCFMIKTSSAVMAEIAAFSGFDCIWIDMEHTANDWSDLEKQVMAAKLYDVDTVVRVPRGSYSDYINPHSVVQFNGGCFCRELLLTGISCFLDTTVGCVKGRFDKAIPTAQASSARPCLGWVKRALHAR